VKIYDKGRAVEHRVLTQRWREEHAERGDLALLQAASLADTHAPERAQAWALIATAHYAAANVRARPIADVAPASSTIPADPASWPL
jgi:hypothetical protein